MSLEDVFGLTKFLAGNLRVDAGIFGDISQMFWRFDFSGDGVLNEEEAVKLCLYMLRSYRDATRQPAPGCVRLGGQIKYKNVAEGYDVKKKLGQGGQGAVYLASDKRTGQEVVVKYYDKSSPNAPVEDITAEFELMANLKHPRIAHYFDIFQDQVNIYVVQEPYFGGDLTTAVYKATQAKVRVDEKWQARVMHQVLAGVAFLHSKEIMHCDLKEANVMIAGREDWHEPQVVVIDFGLSNSFSSQSHPGGTPGYMPPEVWEYGLWTPKGDVFSIGVMLFTMRTGTSPFVEGARSIEQVKAFTSSKQLEMTMGSAFLKALTLSMLAKNFQLRPSVSAAMQNDWFSSAGSDPTVATMDAAVLAKITARMEATELHKALMADLASKQNLAEMRELNNLFLQLDRDNNGNVSAEEVRRGLAGKWPLESIETLVKAMSFKADGELSYEEFMGQLIAAKEPEENQLLAKVFNDADPQSKGFLDLGDLAAILQRPAVAKVLGNRDPAALLAEMDRDGNGRVDFVEFRAAMQGRDAGSKGKPQGRSDGEVLQNGQKLQYYSTSHNSWIPCTVTSVDARSGAIQIDIKPKYWMQGQELRKKLRLPSAGHAVSPMAGVGRQLFAGAMAG